MAGIIKADGSEQLRTATAPVAYRFMDISKQANVYLENARAEAAKIVEEARAEAAKIQREAEIKGQQTALQQAQRSALSVLDQRLQTLYPALQEAVNEIQQTRLAWQNRWEKNAIRLATTIASRVIRKETQQDPQIARKLLDEALQLASGNDRVVIHLHPDDAQAVADITDTLRRKFQSIGEIELAPSDEIEPGGCVINTDFGTIDQQFHAQLKRIEEELSSD